MPEASCSTLAVTIPSAGNGGTTIHAILELRITVDKISSQNRATATVNLSHPDTGSGEVTPVTTRNVHDRSSIPAPAILKQPAKTANARPRSLHKGQGDSKASSSTNGPARSPLIGTQKRQSWQAKRRQILQNVQRTTASSTSSSDRSSDGESSRTSISLGGSFTSPCTQADDALGSPSPDEDDSKVHGDGQDASLQPSIEPKAEETPVDKSAPSRVEEPFMDQKHAVCQSGGLTAASRDMFQDAACHTAIVTTAQQDTSELRDPVQKADDMVFLKEQMAIYQNSADGERAGVDLFKVAAEAKEKKLRERLATAEAKNTKLEQQLSNKMDKEQDLQRTIKEQEAESAELRGQVAEGKQQLSHEREAKEQLQSKIKTQETKDQQQKKEIDNLKSQVAAVENGRDVAMGSNLNLQMQTQRLAMQNCRLRAQCTSGLATRRRLHEQTQFLHRRLRYYDRQLRGQAVQSQTLRRKLSQVLKETRLVKSLCTAALARENALERRIDQLGDRDVAPAARTLDWMVAVVALLVLWGWASRTTTPESSPPVSPPPLPAETPEPSPAEEVPASNPPPGNNPDPAPSSTPPVPPRKSGARRPPGRESRGKPCWIKKEGDVGVQFDKHRHLAVRNIESKHMRYIYSFLTFKNLRRRRAKGRRRGSHDCKRSRRVARQLS